MQYALLAVGGAAMGAAVKRMRLLRRCGCFGAAKKLYRRCAWAVGLGVYVAMALQELLLLWGGQLTLRNGLPLHLCSLTGLITLPMLLREDRILWHGAVYAGMPGALLALLFPSVIATPWPQLTEAAFFSMHVLLVLAPLLPLGLGWRPRPVGALHTAGLMGVAALGAGVVNSLTGGNYLFLAGPVPGTPLMLLARHGVAAYRLYLAGGCLLLLALEALAVRIAAGRLRK